MHPALTENIIERLRTRFAEGDCPTGERPGREMVEFALIELADERQKLRSLISDLSSDLTDEGASYSTEGLHEMRRTVANMLPKDDCPDWLHEYRDTKIG